jgi:hypothetical protein
VYCLSLKQFERFKIQPNISLMKLKQLIDEVEIARENFINSCLGLSREALNYNESGETWSITEVVEHIVRAEWGGVCGIWQAIDGYRNNEPVWSGDNTNEGLSIEQVVENTWQKHQPAPEPARPQWGGSIDFWLVCLKNCKATLAETYQQLEGLDPEKIIYPHPISGPLNVYQRMEFLRYHMERHQRQIEKNKSKFKSQNQ